MELTKIEKKNLVDEVYRQMREMIVSGAWKEGDKLASEHQLASYFDVSRVVVREALQRLRTEHLILTRQGMGSFVSSPRNFITNLSPTADLSISESEFMDLMELRRCLEFHAIELSATRATDEDFTQIMQALDMMKQSEHDLDSLSEADYNFHYAIIQSAHNMMFCRAMDSCRDLVYSCFREMNR